MNTLQNPIPTRYWAIAGAGLVWNLLGLGAFFSQVTMSDAALRALPEAERALYENMPLWALFAFGAAVCGGVLGCILLILRNRLAGPVFLVSLIGVVVQMMYNFFIANTMEVYGPGSILMPIMVLMIAIALVLFARYAAQQGWLR